MVPISLLTKTVGIRRSNVRKQQQDMKMKVKLARDWWKTKAAILFKMILTLFEGTLSVSRPMKSCKRLPRGQGWWTTIWAFSDDQWFKKNLCVSRATFLFMSNSTKLDLQKEEVTEMPSSPEI